jgi:hypothetical protein
MDSLPRNRSRLALCALFLAAATPAAAGEMVSAYTRLDLAACREVPPASDDPLPSGAWWCDGYEGVPVYVSEGDLRFFVSYGEGAADELAARTTLPAFNHPGGTIEWRLERGRDDGVLRPVATILRFYTATGEGQPEGQVLVITRLGGPGEICHVGYVDARLNPDANHIARQVADEAASGFVCGQETAFQYGLVGDDARE